MYKIIDDCITKKKQKFIIETKIDNYSFPWYLQKDVSFDNGQQQRPCFAHIFVNEAEENSHYFNLIKPLFLKYIKKQIINCKTIIQLPLKKTKSTYDTPHVDSKKPHQVYLYYVMDSDGETVLFKNNKIHKKIKPKQGRLLIFDGSILHTAYQPQHNLRCVININESKDERYI